MAGGIGAFVAWVMIKTGHEAVLHNIAGSYLAYHFGQWTARLFLWGPIVLISALLALAASWLILKKERTGGYLSIVSFLIGFVVDILDANVMFVHILVCLLIRWVLLSPLVFGWDEIFD